MRISKLLGEQIRRHRLNNKMSQETLGDKAELSEKYISQIEHGSKNISVQSLHRITCALGVSLEELFRSIDPTSHNDELNELIKFLAIRSSVDQNKILTIVKVIFGENPKK